MGPYPLGTVLRATGYMLLAVAALIPVPQLALLCQVLGNALLVAANGLHH